MYKKIINLYLISLSVFFLGAITNCLAEVENNIEWAKQNIFTLIDSGSYPEAESATIKLVADFAGNKDLARKLWEVANRYDKFKAFEYSESLCKKIVANYPEDKYATYAGLQLAKLKAYELIDAGSYESANAVVSQIKNDFAGHKQLSRRLYEIAKKFDLKSAFAHTAFVHAKASYAQVASDYPNDKYGSYAAIQLARLRIYELIDAGNYAAADQAVLKMKVDFAEHPLLFSRLDSIAEKYEEIGGIVAAERIYQQIIQDHRDSTDANTAKMYLAGMKVLRLVDVGNDAAAGIATDRLITDFQGDPYLPDMVFRIGELYYSRVLQLKNKGFITEAQDKYAKAKDAWEKIITDLPQSKINDRAYYYAALCYRQLGDYEKAIEYYQTVVDVYPGFELAWNAQFLIGYCYQKLSRNGTIPDEIANDRTRTAYDQVMQKYPSCKAAKAAGNWLSDHPNRK